MTHRDYPTQEALDALKELSLTTDLDVEREMLSKIHWSLDQAITRYQRTNEQRGEERSNEQQRINDTVHDELLHTYLDGLVKEGATFADRHDLVADMKSSAQAAIEHDSDMAESFALDYLKRADFYAIADHYEDLIATAEEDDEEGSDDE